MFSLFIILRLYIGQVINALHAATDEIEKGALITIDLKKTRLRVLPLF